MLHRIQLVHWLSLESIQYNWLLILTTTVQADSDKSSIRRLYLLKNAHVAIWSAKGRRRGEKKEKKKGKIMFEVEFGQNMKESEGQSLRILSLDQTGQMTTSTDIYIN